MEVHSSPNVNQVGIWLSAAEVNEITGRLVKLPYKIVAPIVQILGQKMMEAVKNGS